MAYREFDCDLYLTLVKLGFKHVIQHFDLLTPAEVGFEPDENVDHYLLEPIYEHLPYHEADDNAIYHIDDPEVMEMSARVENVYFWVKQPI
ncbi:MAG: hypothetical protein JSS82_08070 [Bacteroidetes bacterium]|nr:hypothetical protein [Bacteroidota bacterium]